MTRLNLALAAAAVAVSASAASAATITVTNITGEWQNAVAQDFDVETGTWLPPYAASPTDIVIENPTDVMDEAIAFWGDPVVAGKPSAYIFDPMDAPFVVESSPFDLGVFTHNNFTIYLSPMLYSIDLAVTIEGTIDDTPFSFTPIYNLQHEETHNEAEVCSQGGIQPCPDLVRISENIVPNQETRSIDIDGVRYLIELFGFAEYAGSTFLGDETAFLTLENQPNSAILRANVRTELLINPEPPEEPSPVPLPAAGWLLLAAVGGLGWAKRRRG